MCCWSPGIRWRKRIGRISKAYSSSIPKRWPRRLYKRRRLKSFRIFSSAARSTAELKKARRKEEFGIRAFLTQPLSSRQAEENLFRARKELRGYLLGGLFPIVSYKNACFLQKNVAGMAIDPEIVRSYENLDREQGEERARELCLEIADRTAEFVDGFYIMTPFQRVELVKSIIAGIRKADETHADSY